MIKKLPKVFKKLSGVRGGGNRDKWKNCNRGSAEKLNSHTRSVIYLHFKVCDGKEITIVKSREEKGNTENKKIATTKSTERIRDAEFD